MSIVNCQEKYTLSISLNGLRERVLSIVLCKIEQENAQDTYSQTDKLRCFRLFPKQE